MIRLWLEDLSQSPILLNQKQAHYLFKVMRKKPGDEILVFNGTEWRARLDKTHIHLTSKVRDFEVASNKSIAVACIKKHRMEILIEKVTELGVDNIYLLETDYSQKAYYNLDRMRTIAIEASEQSNRLTVPTIFPPQKLVNFIADRSNLVLCYQGGINCVSLYDKCLIIGPEGGWSDNELNTMQEIPKLCLSKNILRAETAAIVAGSLLCNCM